jgi:hypothetical protein
MAPTGISFARQKPRQKTASPDNPCRQNTVDPGVSPGPHYFTTDTRSLDRRARNYHEIAVVMMMAVAAALIAMMVVVLCKLHAAQVFGG